MTEGILTRILQHDPSLHGYGLVIFDEFHERSLQADLGLAFTLQTQSLFREDLRLLIMSATLDTRILSQQLPQAPVLTCKGKMFPVETRYLGTFDKKEFARQVANTIDRLLQTEHGNILVFLPGAGEIQRVEEHLSAFSLPQQTLITPLYGNLPPQTQDQAIESPPATWRKVVLSTNIAETSLTIEGIRIVLDTGLMRVSRFDARSGMSRLTTIQVSRQSAEQRRGRAGRLEAGLCLRCWPENLQRTLTARTSPEILDADLTSLALELAVWGIHDPAELMWLDPPPAGAFNQACQLLQSLGALDREGRITTHGMDMANLPIHPRLGHMVLQGTIMEIGMLACDLAAMLNEPNLFKRTPIEKNRDLRSRIEELYRQATRPTSRGMIQQVRNASEQWRHMLGITTRPGNRTCQIDHIGVLLAFAYPDRIAQRQTDGSRQYKLANGRMARFHHPDPLEHEAYLVIADLDGAQPVSRIYSATPIHQHDLQTFFPDHIQTNEHVEWDEKTESVLSNREHRLGKILLKKLVFLTPTHTSYSQHCCMESGSLVFPPCPGPRINAYGKPGYSFFAA